ncbi:MAG: hypothetical protein NHF97_01475, partial [Flavobacteriia bacterium]|nr:hypothetical protein [Candidatus Bostrichicola ureolyticus]
MIKNFVKVILLTFIFYSIGCINNIVVNCKQKYQNVKISNLDKLDKLDNLEIPKFDFKRLNLEYPYIKKISFLVKYMIESEKFKIKKFEFGTKN